LKHHNIQIYHFILLERGLKKDLTTVNFCVVLQWTKVVTCDGHNLVFTFDKASIFYLDKESIHRNFVIVTLIYGAEPFKNRGVFRKAL